MKLIIIDANKVTEEFATEQIDGEININPLDIAKETGQLDRETVKQFTKGLITMRGCTSFQMKAFYLSDDYDWIMGKTSSGSTVLIPVTKERPFKSEIILNQLKSMEKK